MVRQLLVSASLLVQALGASLQVLQWNPHWQCTRNTICKANVKSSLEVLLPDNDIDFANVVEFNDLSWVPPAGWKRIEQACPRDNVTLIYNTLRWTIPTSLHSSQYGCMQQKDRAFVTQHFVSKVGLDPILVVGAHYPHGKSPEELKAAISTVVKQTAVSSVVVLADTNDASGAPASTLLLHLGLVGTLGSPPARTCCYDNGFRNSFDRVFANFGSSIQSSVLFDQVPSWAHVTEFHKAVLAKITFGYSVPTAIPEKETGSSTTVPVLNDVDTHEDDFPDTEANGQARSAPSIVQRGPLAMLLLVTMSILLGFLALLFHHRDHLRESCCPPIDSTDLLRSSLETESEVELEPGFTLQRQAVPSTSVQPPHHGPHR